MIHPTECVCFPRSGHHALTDVLRTYFGDEFHYCEIYLDPPDKHIGAGSVTNFQKSHDFPLDTPIVPGRQYLVQVRNPLHALRSWKILSERLGGPPFEFDRQLEFWTGFTKKWVYGPVPNRFIVEYENLVASPQPTMVEVIQFLTRSQNVDMDRLDSALQKFPLAARAVRPL